MKKGDRVVCIKGRGVVKVGMKGTFFALEGESYDVIWDKVIHGHSGGEPSGTSNKHYYVRTNEFKLITSSIIYNYLIL